MASPALSKPGSLTTILSMQNAGEKVSRNTVALAILNCTALVVLALGYPSGGTHSPAGSGSGQTQNRVSVDPADPAMQSFEHCMFDMLDPSGACLDVSDSPCNPSPWISDDTIINTCSFALIGGAAHRPTGTVRASERSLSAGTQLSKVDLAVLKNRIEMARSLIAKAAGNELLVAAKHDAPLAQ